MRIGLIVFLFFIPLNICAQTVIVSGTVSDSLSNKLLDGATVLIKNEKGEITYALSAQNGSFKTTIDSSLAKSVTISYAGFKAKIVPFTYSSVLKEYKLGTIYLYEEASSLTAVVVKGSKPPLNFKVDRQVYKASQYGNALNGNAIDLIRNLPSISVNGQGEISLRGSNSFLVLLNGKPSQGDPAMVLSQLAAGSIESMEVITSPSALYDADGKSGIINIITKSGTENGWMLQTNAMYGTPPFNNFDNKRNASPQRYSTDILTAYRNKQLDWSIGLNVLRNDQSGFREGDVYTIVNNVKTSFPSQGERSFKRYNYGGRMAASYQFNKNNKISSGFYIGKKYQSRVADLYYFNQRSNLQTGMQSNYNYYNENTQEKSGNFTLANLDFSHNFDENTTITHAVLFERAALSGLTQNLNLMAAGLNDTIQYTRNPNSNPLNAWRFKSDFTKNLKNKVIQAGYQLKIDQQEGDFLYLTKMTGTSNFFTDPLFTSNVKVANKIHAAYLQMNQSIEKWYYAAGLRLEQSNRVLRYSQAIPKDELNLTNLFPSLLIRYHAWENGTIKGGYNRRIKRTNNFELNPFPEREHSETLEQGDPQLKPELIGNYELGLEQKMNKGNFYLSVYHQQITNPIQRVNKVFNDTILNRIFTNAGKAIQVGGEFNVSHQPRSSWQSSIGGNIYKYTIKGSLFNGSIPIQNSSWVFSLNVVQSFSLQNNWSVQFSVNYLSLRATAQGEDDYFLTPHLLLKKTSKDKRWTFQAQWLNMDAGLQISNRQRITTKGNNFFSTTNYIYEPDQLQISASFNLLKKNRKINLPVSEMGEKEF